jgi:DNA-binding GntR family transcriptional regulator
MSADSLKRAGTAYLKMRDRAEVARIDLHKAIREASGTMSEPEIAQRAGVSRMTVRKALGKR